MNKRSLWTSKRMGCLQWVKNLWKKDSIQNSSGKFIFQ